MNKKILFLCFFVCSLSYGQYTESAPWMSELNKNESSSANKSKNQQYSIYEITDSFNEYWKTRDSNVKGSGFKPYKRWENYWIEFVNKDGNLPTSQELWSAWQKKQDPIGKITNPTSNWSSIGPIDTGVIRGSLPGQGRINAITVDPNDPNTWYAGAPAGGIWKSTNAGDFWVNLFDDFPQIGVSGIAVDPNNSDIIYISTGDDDGGDSFSVGVYKSIDAGSTWNETGLNVNNTSIGSRFNEITIDPENSNIIWVGSNSGLFRSTNGGDTWEVRQNGSILDFKLKPDDSNTIYAVSRSQYFKSVDAGDTFIRITDSLPANSGRLVLGVSPADPEVVYVLSAATNTDFQGLFRSSDSGETFTDTGNTSDIFESNQAFFDLALEVSPTDANVLFTGCLNIWRSRTGGRSFTRVNQWFVNNNSYSHADIHTLKFFNGTLFCGSDGGLYSSDDEGVNFTDRTTNMAVSQFYRISVATDDDSRIAGGTQDNAGFLLNNGSWNVYTGGDGMDYEIDPNNSNIIYGFVQLGRVLFITNDVGESIATVNQPTDINGNDIDGNWITPLTVASNGNVYSGFDGVYRLDGNAWVKISNDFGNGSNIDDLEVDPNNPLVLYAAIDNFIFRSLDGGVNFSELTRFNSDISSIALNSSDPNILYVTTSRRIGSGIPLSSQQPQRGVFKLTINGNNAVDEDITFNLPTDQAYYTIVHQGRHSDNPIYVGTNLGVYRLDDTLTEWEEYFTDLPSTGVGDLEINLNAESITAATYGRGIWQSPIPVEIPDNDVRLVSLNPPSNTIICGEIFPEIVVENNGLNPITEIEVNYTINNEANQNFTSTNTLNPGETATILLPSINSTTLGLVNLVVNVSIPNDTFSENNEINRNFFANSFATGDDISDFESDTESLLTFNNSDNENSVWERGVPNGTVLNQASSGTQVYGTNLDGNHPDNTTGFLVSGCYELSSILAPVLKFNMAYSLEQNFDIVFVQYSTDDGISWNLLGNINSQPNWYTSDRTNASSGAADDCQNCPGGQWTGSNSTLTEYVYDFVANASNGETDLTNEPNMLFRLVFQSDPNVNEEGVIIDDFVIEGLQDDNDDDDDGVLDVNDNCPLTANTDQLDTDGDGEGNSCDDDDDNDGILDIDDNCPLIANIDQLDIDGDGVGDVCDNDSDNDGLNNDIDLCPNTPLNAVVDVTGCAVFSLPVTNFRVLSTGESCISSNDGSISINAEEALNYTATITGNSISSSQSFSDTTSFNDLLAGNYTICITVENQPDYENCLGVTVVEPEALSVTSKISSLSNAITLSLSGGIRYVIQVNDKEFRTSEDEITIPLVDTENKISVRTDKDCQGIFNETVFLNSEVFIYPNPISSGDMTVLIGNIESNNVDLSLFTVQGEKIFKKPYEVVDGKIIFNVDALSAGVYILNVKTETSLLTYKIFRR